MPERTAAEVLAEKLQAALFETRDRSGHESYGCTLHVRRGAARLAEDPAITVRTDMVVERFVVEFHTTRPSVWQPWDLYQALVQPNYCLTERPGHRIIVRPYPEEPDA